MIVSDKKILAIIPARGGSKRIPGKNIRFLAGEPLICHTIKAALKSKNIGRVIVSTEDDKIAEISRKNGAEVLVRPAEMADDNSKTIDVLFHLLGEVQKENYEPDIIILLQPTSPLRNETDIDQALDFFSRKKCESLVGVCELPHPFCWALELKKEFLFPVFGLESLKIRSQDAPKKYICNGAIYIASPSALRKNEGFFSEKTLAYVMPREKSLDIDKESDFKLAELILKNYAGNQNRK